MKVKSVKQEVKSQLKIMLLRSESCKTDLFF